MGWRSCTFPSCSLTWNMIPQSWVGRITYQDPCRLGRHLGIYDAPRSALAGLGFDLVEMERTRHASLCCGTSCWTSCGQVSKNIQVERLKEARATGAQMLVTACVKCQIHFRCAQDDPALRQENVPEQSGAGSASRFVT